jgi:dipeptidyl aminopeptidase/acylaminoacyl peptidase
MGKKLLAVILSIAILLVSLAGCIELRQYVQEAGLAPKASPTEYYEDLPTLPVLADLIPLNVFTSFFEYTAPDISGDGNTVLYRNIKGYTDKIIAKDWRTGEETIVRWPDEVDGIPHYFWAPDGKTVLFFVDSNADENYGVYTSNIETGKTSTVLPGGTTNCYYVSDNPKNLKEIYIEMLDFERKLYDLYLLNYETGKKTLVLENPGDITSYIFDYDGNLTLVTTNDDNAGKHVWLNTGFKSGTAFIQDDWKRILSWDYEDAESSGIWGMMPDMKSFMYVDSSRSNTKTLYNYDISTGTSTEIFNDPSYDIVGSWTDLEMGRVTAVTVYGQKNEWHILDESFRDDFEILNAAGDDFKIIDSSSKDEYWIVAYTSDVKEMDYYLYDMEKKELIYLYNAQPDLGQYKFAPTEPFSYTTGDGLKIEGYATFPLGAEKKDLPTVMLVHGGPWARDTWGFDKEVQLLASRGYLVLRVNFRGSTGYGKDFMNAGDLEWGGLMHQDILDAVDYATGQGWADPERVGVYGASYGGYEALVCAAFSSDVFKCAVDAFGPSSLLTFVESIPPQWELARKSLEKSVGNPAKDAELMKSRSPLYYAKDIKIPLLIAQGDNDPRVPQKESDQMVEALREAGVDVTYLLFENTGHGLGYEPNKLRFYSEVEKFFAENLGGMIGK